MSKTFRPWKIDEPLFLPPMVQDFVAKNHLARFVLSLVGDEIDLVEVTGCYGSERPRKRREVGQLGEGDGPSTVAQRPLPARSSNPLRPCRRVPAGANAASLSVESQAVRYRDDGVPPTCVIASWPPSRLAPTK